MSDSPLLESMQDWTEEQLLAAHDFCQLMSDAIWQHHAEQLLAHLQARERADETEACVSSVAGTGSTSSFDDELPF